ncbi:DUF1285 domain-containing protein [Thalassotalea euphylliae]|uniref:DUF1285 domain-containing protein n=1 Tax=Thalassotalea euphylliae TaxID=1655234 RepID=A0A3E0TYI6_9GAMM|nr:DUF1285 domain-containing protein [Thalassotalea euphylliae]REL29045.1 DUF1285 domain-containing protein [Thalassotalea euphylliae]
MSLDNLFAQLDGHLSGEEKQGPPVELWNPEYCGEINLQIKQNGDWFYMGTPFKRLSLVKLFASVLKKEGDEFFLVTPVEKVKIQVEDSPFLITRWEWQGGEPHSDLLLATNLGDELVLSEHHPLRLDGEGNIYITVRRNLEAKVHRNVYYQWVEAAQEVATNGCTSLFMHSQGRGYEIGRY